MKHPDLPDDHDVGFMTHDDDSDVRMLGIVIIYCALVLITALAVWWIA